MKNSKMFVKGALLATMAIVGNSGFAQEVDCSDCSAHKVIELAHRNGITNINSMNYMKGNWKVEGVNDKNVEVAADINCPQCDGSSAQLITVGEISHVAMTVIVEKVMAIATGKIKNVKFNGYRWEATVIDETVEVIYQFDKNGALIGQLVID